MADALYRDLGPTRDADEKVQSICGKVKAQAEAKTGMNYGVFKAIKYRAQTVARIIPGTNYFIKVHVGGVEYIHLHVWIGFIPPQKLDLMGVQEHKTLDDPIKPF